MAETRPDATLNTDMENTVTTATVNALNTTANDYQCRWSDWYGYYFEIPPIQAIVDRKSIWTVGKGYKAAPKVQKRLDRIRGMGKDTFNTIMQNGVKTYTIGGDFLAEIVQTKKGELVNLKPLNPGSIKIVANSRGIIKRYEQLEPINTSNLKPMHQRKTIQNFKPEEMFHLAYNRTADEIHGVGIIQKIEQPILAYKEAVADLRILFHRYVKPLIISSVDTDDPDEIEAYKKKLDIAVENGENMVVPKGVLDKMERMSVPQYSTLDPLPWINYLEAEFVRAEGVPQIIQGASSALDTEAAAKILYLGWQQVIEFNQMFLEQQLKAQLGIKVDFEFPARIDFDMQEQQKKDRKLSTMDGDKGGQATNT